MFVSLVDDSDEIDIEKKIKEKRLELDAVRSTHRSFKLLRIGTYVTLKSNHRTIEGGTRQTKDCMKKR